MATSPKKLSKEELEQIKLTAERARERDAKKKKEEAARRREELDTAAKTTKRKPPVDGGISDMSIQDQLEAIKMEKLMQQGEAQARDLSGKRPQGLKNGGMVTTCRGQGRVMKKRQTRIT